MGAGGERISISDASDCRLAVDAHRVLEWTENARHERFRAHVGWGKFALTASMSVNGGAAIAILHAFPELIQGSAGSKLWLFYALLAFGCGVAMAVLCGALAYLGDGLKYASQPEAVAIMSAVFHRTDLKPPSIPWAARNLHYFTGVIWVLSWLAFCGGIYAVSRVIAV